MGIIIGLWRASIGRFRASFKSYYESKRETLAPIFHFLYVIYGIFSKYC